MVLSVHDLIAVIERCARRLKSVAPELNELDGQLGDGDLGATLQKCAVNLEAAVVPAPATVDALFKACAMACARASGSSFGTLLSVAFLSAARETAGQPKLAREDLAPLLDKILAALMARGGASPGDKTVLDPLKAVQLALAAQSDCTRQHEVACKAVDATLDAFRGKPNRIGRARMFAERSIGLDDPGMVAFRYMVIAAGGEHIDHEQEK
jgi:dihydroxyacetone kinase-like protein